MEKKELITPLIIGKFGYDLTEEEKLIYLKLNPLGFILFTRNLSPSLWQNVEKSQASPKNLIKNLKNIFPTREVQIWLDEEGGANSRLIAAGFEYEKNLYTSLNFYKMYQEKGIEETEKAVYEQFLMIGKHLKTLGFTGTFAPVADLYHKNKSQVIGERSFGPEVDIVIKLCKMSLKALNETGIDSCIKHLPGHGLAEVDSHYFLPCIKEDEKFLLDNDFKVFKELAPLVKYAMTAHIVYEFIDKTQPITLSKKGIDYLRKNIGLKNVKIITDAIDMKALYVTNDGSERSISQVKDLCFEAGCDIVLYCHPNLKILETFLI